MAAYDWDSSNGLFHFQSFHPWRQTPQEAKCLCPLESSHRLSESCSNSWSSEIQSDPVQPTSGSANHGWGAPSGSFSFNLQQPSATLMLPPPPATSLSESFSSSGYESLHMSGLLASFVSSDKEYSLSSPFLNDSSFMKEARMLSSTGVVCQPPSSRQHFLGPSNNFSLYNVLLKPNADINSSLTRYESTPNKALDFQPVVVKDVVNSSNAQAPVSFEGRARPIQQSSSRKINFHSVLDLADGGSSTKQVPRIRVQQNPYPETNHQVLSQPTRAIRKRSTFSRTPISELQRQKLSEAYLLNTRPDRAAIESLANTLSLKPSVVRTWFQNRRNRSK